MSSVPPPVLGFNNNVKHRGRIFHIQTEDSGTKSPRIVTHLFADGGRIIRTTRTEYAEHLTRADLQPFVRALMKEQHKGMFLALRQGDLDALLEDACGPFEEPLTASKAPSLPSLSGPPEAAPDSVTASGNGHGSSSAQPNVGRGSTPDFDGHGVAAPASNRGERISDRPEASRALINPNLRKVAPSGPPVGASAFELDVAALESLSANPPRTSGELPPSAPPSSGSVKTLRKTNPPPRKLRPMLPKLPALPAPSARPTARFSSSPPKPPPSLFGEGVISEQSLDEVILSYLAEELDPTE